MYGIFNFIYRCNIPVVIMGETGCGKTRLIRYMCELQKRETSGKNLVMLKVEIMPQIQLSTCFFLINRYMVELLSKISSMLSKKLLDWLNRTSKLTKNFIPYCFLMKQILLKILDWSKKSCVTGDLREKQSVIMWNSLLHATHTES